MTHLVGIHSLVRIVLLLCLLLALSMYIGRSFIDSEESEFIEVTKLAQISLTISEYEDYFTALADQKGAVYAFDVLRQAKFPAGINVHEIGHRIGEKLYLEQGVTGIKVCTAEFRNACAHSIVIGYLVQYGEAAFSDVVRACTDAPGGRGGYYNCFHGVGHGILAYTGYDFNQAMQLCKKIDGRGILENDIQNEIPKNARFTNIQNECVAGVVMEMTEANHDKKAWQEQRSKYVPKDDIFMPCNSQYVAEEVRLTCYLYLTERLLATSEITEGLLPTSLVFQNAMSHCGRLKQVADRTACYGGFGKQFVFYATQEDGTLGAGGDINQLSENALKTIHAWCMLSNDIEGIRECNLIALDTLFWYGQNNPSIPNTFCSLIETSLEKDGCYTRLIWNVQFFATNSAQINTLCEEMPRSYHSLCRNTN